MRTLSLRTRAVWFAAVAALTMTVSAGCVRNAAPAAPTPTASGPRSAPASSPADPAYVTARIRLGRKPCGVAAASDRVWVSNYVDGTLQWVDVATNRAGPPIPVGRLPCGIALGADSVWVENFGSANVTRVDAASGAVLATIGVGAQPYDVTFAAGAIWVTDWADGTVSRIDPADNRRSVITTGGRPAGIVAAGGALWVGLTTDGVAARIDPTSQTVTDRVPTGAGASWTAAIRADVWLSNGRARTVTRIDAASRRAVATVPVEANPLDGDAAGGAIWIPVNNGGLYRIDPATNAVTGSFRSGVTLPFVAAGMGDALWIADYAGTDLVRLDTTAIR